MKNLILALSMLMAANVWAGNKVKEQVVNIEVTENGFRPKSLDVTANTPIVLNIIRKTDATCAKEIQIPTEKIKKDLPLNKAVSIKISKLKKGEIRFGCGLNMMESGIIHAK